jgi:hypothetical protein
MDHANRFESKTTYRLLRAEYAVALGVCVALFAWHLSQVRWLPALVLFVYMHSFVTQAAVIGIWIAVAGPEWALLAVPIHLCGDRALFGNFLKPFRVPFEPKALPAFVRFEEDVIQPRNRVPAQSAARI